MKTKPVPSAAMSLTQSRDWIEASVFQGERLMALLDAQVAVAPKDMTRERWKAFQKANVLPGGQLVEFYEGFFFVCAVQQARRWLELAAPHWAALGPAVAAFCGATPHVIDVRDMLTHEDEYLAGGGRNAERYRMTFPGTLMESSAHSVVSAGKDEYLLGGRVSVPGTMRALYTLRPSVVALCEANRVPTGPP